MQLVKHVYENFAGVDFANDTVNLNRSPDTKNVYKNYFSNEGVVLETREGLSKLFTATGKLYGLFFYEKSTGTQVIVHCGTKLYKWNNFPNANTLPEHKTELYSGMIATKSKFFTYNDYLYILDGAHYLRYDGSTCSSVVGTIPITSIARAPSGGGTIYQDVNVLSPYRYNQFVGDGTSKVYQLDTVLLDSDYTPVITVNGSTTTNFTMNYTLGQITFTNAPSSSSSDNVIVKFKKTVSGYADRILNCTLLTTFDYRVFFSGNPSYKNIVFNSKLEDPAYFSDVDYEKDGTGETAIVTLLKDTDHLIAVKEESQNNPTIFYHTPTLDSAYGKVYPSREVRANAGCYADGINFYDDIVFLSKDGLWGIDDLTSSQPIHRRSSNINPKLINEFYLDEAQLENWRGYLLCLVNGKMYLADSRQKYGAIDGHLEYEWYFWDNLGVYDGETFYKACLLKEYDGELYIGTENGFICKYTGTNDDGKSIESYWVTPKDKYGYENMLKTTNKRGCVAKLKSVIAKCRIARKSSNDVNFEDIVTYDTTTSTDYVTIKNKKKKWIEIQYKFYSNTLDKPFGIHNLISEVFVGGYVK